MNGKLVVAVALLLCLAANSVRAGGDVIDLDPENFDSLTSRGVWLVEYYAPWCGFCARLEPEWEKVATWGKTADVNVGRVNCDVHKMLCRRFDVQGYPTIKLVSQNKLYDFPEETERTLEAFTKFATTQYTTLEAKEVPVGNAWFDPIIAYTELYVLDLIAVYENNLLPGIALFLVGFFASVGLALFVLPTIVGFPPTLFVPRTMYVLRRPGQPPQLVSEPHKYKLKAE